MKCYRLSYTCEASSEQVSLQPAMWCTVLGFSLSYVARIIAIVMYSAAKRQSCSDLFMDNTHTHTHTVHAPINETIFRYDRFLPIP